ncbi:MAG: hypothetical protein IPN09_14480 [Bacteroidetes bacterium]|nr:hypothetical protein [Bacteroidota bacterium]
MKTLKKGTKVGLMAMVFLLSQTQTLKAQFGKKLKEALIGNTTTQPANEPQKEEVNKPKVLVNDYVLSDFQKSNVGKVVVFNDYLGARMDESTIEAASSTELAEHFIMRAYFDKNVRDAYEKGFDIVFSCDEVVVSLNKFRYISNENYLKIGGPTGKTPGILPSYYAMADLKYEKFWKNEKIFSTGLLPKKEDSEYDAMQYMFYPVENTFRYFLNRCSPKMAVGKSINIKIQFYTINNEVADSWKATDAEKVLVAEGTHVIKITENTKKLTNNIYRFEDSDYMEKTAVNETLKKGLKLLYPTEIAEVYKVQMNSDFTTKSNTYGQYFQWAKARIILKAKSDGTLWSCNVEPHYKYNGSGFDNTPYEVIFINRHLVPTIGIPEAK